MLGEDFRSQAVNHAEKIIELKEVIAFLKAEPAISKQNYLALMTRFRRCTEQQNMVKEEMRQEILRLHRVIA